MLRQILALAAIFAFALPCAHAQNPNAAKRKPKQPAAPAARARPATGIRAAKAQDFNPRAPQPDETAPDFHAITAKGADVRLTADRGKFVVLEFTKPGNEICDGKREAMDTLRAKYEGSETVSFWTILTEEEADERGMMQLRDLRNEAKNYRVDTNAIGKFVAGHQADYPGARVVSDGESANAHREFGSLVNMVYIVDPRGRVAARWPWADPVAIEAKLAVLAGNPTGKQEVQFAGLIKPQLSPGTAGRAGQNRRQTAPMMQALAAVSSPDFIEGHDKNGDGSIQKTEIELPDEVFTRMDRNKDGSLSADEVEVTKQNVAERATKGSE